MVFEHESSGLISDLGLRISDFSYQLSAISFQRKELWLTADS